MARKCDICGRGPKVIIKRSHSHIGVRTRQLLNLQKVTIKGEKMKVCTKCLKGLYKEKKVKSSSK